MEQYANTKAGKQARNLHQELSVVGKEAPDTWSIDRWFQGETQFDSSSAGPTVVVFWETWCPHCRREVPKLQKVYEDYRDQGLQMVGLSRMSKNATEATMRSFIAEHGLGFPLAVENGTLSAHFGVSGIPAAAVVLNGEVVWRGHPARLSRSMIDSWVQ